MTLGLDGCATPGAIVRLALAAMGTRFELVLVGPREPELLAAGEAALEEIKWWHNRLSRFERDSDVAFIAREAHLRTASNPIALDPDLLDLLAMCEQARSRCGGVFDVRLGDAMDRWIAGESLPREHAARPMAEIVLDPIRRAIHATGGVPLRLDLGGVAKGFALDRAVEVLRSAGINNAIIHAGTSSIIAIGPGQGGNGWKVRLDGGAERADGSATEDSLNDASSEAASLDVTLHDEAMSVSSPSGRTVASPDGTITPSGHILDPRSGLPAPMGRTVAVLSPLSPTSPTAAANCEIWSTSLIVAPNLLTQLPSLMTAIIRDQSDSDWSVHAAAESGPQRSRARSFPCSVQTLSTLACPTHSAADFAALETL